jgi:hypothetical protein
MFERTYFSGNALTGKEGEGGIEGNAGAGGGPGLK